MFISSETSLKSGKFSLRRAGWVVALLGGVLSTGCGSLKGLGAEARRMDVTATAYSSGYACNGVWAGKNAIGGRLKSGAITSAAADWSKIPVGTKFKVAETGKVYEVDDYGSAMVGNNKVDLYHTNYRDVQRWGVRDVTLEILEWGCWETSLHILRPRSKWAHVRDMVERLKQKTGES